MKNLAKFALLLGILVAAFVLVSGLIFAWNRQRLMSRIEAIRANNDPTSIEEIYQSAIDPAENATTHLVDVVDRMNALYNRVRKDLDVDGFVWQEGLSDETLRKLTKDFDRNADLVVAHQEASRCKHFRWPSKEWKTHLEFNEAILNDIGCVRAIARYNGVYVRFLAAQQKYDKAAQACIDQLRLCRLQDEVPTLTSFLMNIACRDTALTNLNGILRNSKLSQQNYMAIENELAFHDSMDRFVDALKSERAFGLDSFRYMPLLTNHTDQYLDMMGDEIATAHFPHHVTVMMNLPPAVGISETVEPAIEMGREAMNRNIAIIRCLRVLNAIHGDSRFRDSEKVGPNQVDLGSLGLPSEAMIDPYTADKLKIRSTTDGWIVYSLGPDAIDDAGSVGDESDIGVAPPALND